MPGWLGELLTLFAGPLGVVVVFVYSFLVAFVLPFPGEVVLFVPVDLRISRRGELAAIVVVSSVGKRWGASSPCGSNTARGTPTGPTR